MSRHSKNTGITLSGTLAACGGLKNEDRTQERQGDKRELMAEADVGKMKATETLKTLVSKGVLEWVGASTNDPRQYYRPVGIN